MVNRSRDIVNNDGINQLTEFSWIPNSKLDERWVNQRRWSDGNEALIETDWGKKSAGTGASAPFSIGWPMKNCHQLIDTLKSQQLIMSRDLLSIDKWSWKWKELRWWSEWTRRCQVLTNCPRFFQSNNNENNKEKNLGPSRWNRFSWPLISVLFVGWWKESAQVNCDLPFELDWRVFIVTANQGACRWPRLPAQGRSLRCDAWTSSSMTWGHLLCHVRPRWRHRDRWVDDDVADVADVAEGVASWLLWSFIHILLTAECLIFDSFTAIGPVNVVSCYSFPFNLALNLDSIRFDSIGLESVGAELKFNWIELDWIDGHGSHSTGSHKIGEVSLIGLTQSASAWIEEDCHLPILHESDYIDGWPSLDLD